MTNPSGVYDAGRQFEQRAIDLARSIHDPSGRQGSEYFDGKERDGIFVDEHSVFAYEFTTRRDKAKAESDGEKLAELLGHLRRSPEHRFKALQGRFITEQEPTVDQRQAIYDCSLRHGIPLVSMSLVSLRKEMIDTEEYIRLRLQAPFGSAGSSMAAVTEGTGQRRYVESTFRAREDGTEFTTASLFDMLAESRRLVIAGDFGIGKSAALAHIFSLARKAYFRSPSDRRFPVHVNLRELRGLRSAHEVLRRHCEEIGFQNERALIAAWRAGCCDLLLDGFDELVPVNFVGGAKDLAAVRKLALEPVRQLIHDSPEPTGIIIAGRAQYFSSEREILEALGLRAANVLDLQNFSSKQVEEFLGDQAQRVPDWVPTRPVLLQFWMQSSTAGSNFETPGEAWREFVVRVAEREGERVQSITSENLLKLITGIATSCQADSTIYSGISLEEMTDVFRSVFQREPDEEGIQTLMRLPGLVPVDGDPDRRRFVDEDLEDAAFGIAMADYILSPDVPHRLNRSGAWTTASAGLVGEVAAAELSAQGVAANHCIGALKARGRQGFWDAPLLEMARCADAMGAKYEVGNRLTLAGVMIPYLNSSGEGFSGAASFSECLIDELDLSGLDLDSPSPPSFINCAIHHIIGQASIPDRLVDSFVGCEIERFSKKEQTTDGILELPLPASERLGLTVLKKVYMQRGGGRKLSALSRGIPPRDRAMVGGAVDRLVNLGFVRRTHAQSTELILPERSRRVEVMRILENTAQGIPGY